VQVMSDGGTYGAVAGQAPDDSELALVLGRTLVAQGRFDTQTVLGAYRAWRDAGPLAHAGYAASRSEAAGRPGAYGVSTQVVLQWRTTRCRAAS
jgi:ADP-ribosylglycohydrolase